MPPSTLSPKDHWVMSTLPLCCAFPIGEIEVQAVEGSPTKRFSTRILMSHKDETSISSTEEDSSPVSATNKSAPCSDGQDRREDGSSPSTPAQPSRYDYFSTPNSPGTTSLADSFDSTDEIVENSNEAKLIKRVVEKRTGGMQYTMESGWEPRDPSKISNASSPVIDRQDSMSDTNSVNSNDVFMMIDESQEMEYLGVLDQHLMHTSPEETDYENLDDMEVDDYHPRIHQANLDDIIEHLCAAPCGECLPDSPFGHPYPRGRPKSVLRRSRYSATKENSLSHIDTSTKKVCFQDVVIQELKMTLGNHPSATSGPPVMLDSEPFSPKKVMTLEEYESTRPPRRKRRQLKLTLQQRHNILVKERGLRFEEVKEAWQAALEIRKQRKETLERGLALMKWDEVWESSCRKFSRLFDGTI
ncbi:hypothetical protein IV203_006197 [Nitzschia inconspicua]|uniref:Uncharacterized protein n=1 Tax=Nitzschia inconspicua TaxID=303405 RepID=A0A9K3PH33_9STRA|nr:hypothetical protein IV203_006197 [Nitzschia inconspicua]